MTPEEIEAIRTRHWEADRSGTVLPQEGTDAHGDRDDLLREVDTLRARVDESNTAAIQFAQHATRLAGELERAKFEVWDEGYQTAVDDEAEMSNWERSERSPNPYAA